MKRLHAAGLSRTSPSCFRVRGSELYEAAFARLQAAGLIYGCACSRRDVDEVIEAQANWPAGVYPGTCARGVAPEKPIRAYRVRVPDEESSFFDRAAGPYTQHLTTDVGDFVVRRSDGLWAYQLAVVVDDAEQKITHIVRGADLLDNTPRQIYLQRTLGFPTPRYLHVPLVLNTAGEKLSKQTGATEVDAAQPLTELNRAAFHLDMPRFAAHSIEAFLRLAIDACA